MKAQTNSSAGKDVKMMGSLESTKSGKIQKIRKSGGDDKAQEIKAHMAKLQELVPFMPRNRKLSKLEVISNVIDYIHDLRETLGISQSCCAASFTEADMNYSDDDGDLEELCDFPDSVSGEAIPTTTISLSLIRNSESTSSTENSVASPSPYQSQCRQPLCVIADPGNNKKSESDSCAAKPV